MLDKPKVLAYLILRLGVSAHLIAFGLGRLFVAFTDQAPAASEVEVTTGIFSSVLLPLVSLVIGFFVLSGVLYRTAILGAGLLGVVSVLDFSFQGQWTTATPSLIFLLCVFHLMFMIEYNPGISRNRRGSRRGHHGHTATQTRTTSPGEFSHTPEN